MAIIGNTSAIMVELPENLQIIKINSQTPTTPSTLINNNKNIKAKLNQHVKRRLCAAPEKPTIKPEQPNQKQKEEIKNNVEIINQEINNGKKVQKPRRPYQKRKNNNNNNNNKSTIINELQAPAPAPPVVVCNKITDGITVMPIRKGKRRKLICGNEENATTTTIKATRSPLGVDSIEDDSQDIESRTLRTNDKDKNPDVLALILSLKKRALLQEPEIQEFLKQKQIITDI